MVLDSSALVGVVMGEPEKETLLAKIKMASTVGVGAPTVVETLIVLARRLGGDPRPLVSQLFRELKIEVIALTEEHASVALGAFLQFGKGRHPAALNFGDCLAYATAALADQPLLYVGSDFSQTDLRPA